MGAPKRRASRCRWRCPGRGAAVRRRRRAACRRSARATGRATARAARHTRSRGGCPAPASRRAPSSSRLYWAAARGPPRASSRPGRPSPRTRRTSSSARDRHRRPPSAQRPRPSLPAPPRTHRT
eukprot:scaffold49551_cov69-Phaeocystis_antarctica.AAC.2